jgi:single-strand DNA-binding protein
MNNITIAGQLGRDAEVRYLPNGDAVANFSVADSQGKDKPTIWWNCSLFGKRAESLAPYLVKGQSVTVSGNVTEREYTDKEGNQRKQMDIRVADVALQGGKREEQPRAAAKTQPQKQVAKPSSGFDDMDDDIPF